ncbi:MAG: helix-hairpin-helix domain-containing protein [Ichthyobacteriaceae bacterium]|nr:helix-hairpin-helix domain-containing protein [Ichthyobacteriaceae bacterium]
MSRVFKIKFSNSIVVMLLCFSYNTYSQSIPQSISETIIETNIESAIDRTSVNDDVIEGGERFSELAEEFSLLSEYKIDVNNVGVEEIKKLQLVLNTYQISNLWSYLKRNGELYSVYELTSIKGFDRTVIEKLIPFIEILPIKSIRKYSFKDYLKYSKTHLLLKTQILDSPTNNFLDSISFFSSNYSKYIKLKFNSMNRIKLGLTLETDAGEQMLNGYDSVFDYQSFNVEFNNMFGFQKIVIGDYGLEFGQGLVLWSTFGFSKTSNATNVIKLSRGAVSHGGTNENEFFRGAVVQYKISDFSITPFYSNNIIDANLKEHNSIVNSGLHRTDNEIGTQNNVEKQDFGLNVKRTFSKVSTSVTYVETSYNKFISSGNEVRNKFSFSGNKNRLLSVDYFCNLNEVFLAGEFAKNFEGGLAVNSSVLFAPMPEFNATVLYRNINKEYNAFNNSPFAEYSSGAEKGVYIGVKSELNKFLTINAYVDWFEKTWVYYLNDSPSKGTETMFSVDYKFNRQSVLNFRVRHEQKASNVSGNYIGYEVDKNFLNKSVDTNKGTYRLNLKNKISNQFSVSTRAEYVTYKHVDFEDGWLLSEQIVWKPLNSEFQVYASYAVYNTDSWFTRIYIYERDVLYAFSVPAYYGRGERLLIGAKYKILKNINLWARYSVASISPTKQGVMQRDSYIKSLFKFQVQIKL